MKYNDKKITFIITALTILFAIVVTTLPHNVHAQDEEQEPRQRVNIVLVGATGNLAKKYLWQSLFRLFKETIITPNAPSFVVWPAASKPASTASGMLEEILEKNIECVLGIDFVVRADMAICEGDRHYFIKKVVRPYTQLRKDIHYKELNDKINEDMVNDGGADVVQSEAGRLFYLSIPPKFYKSIAKSINDHSRPKDIAWLRVVLEKPFGSDVDTARDLSNSLTEHLKEDEIYRIDHYLGKLGVQSLYDFRVKNRNVYEQYLNNKYVERVEVVMKETEDCAGRTKFYNQYGVIRDVLQNHLTEMAALIAMDLPDEKSLTNSREIIQSKISFLQHVSPPTIDDAVLGQYDGYRSHHSNDVPEKDAREAAKTRQVTFASVKLNVDSKRWKGVPFILTAGKVLDERAAYVRVVFKHKTNAEIIFNVQGGKLGTRISATSEAEPFIVPNGYISVPSDKDPEALTTDAKPLDTPVKNAYEVLVADIFFGRKENFVGTASLLQSWKVWTPLLKEYDDESTKIHTPILYSIGGKEVFKSVREKNWRSENVHDNDAKKSDEL
jgi:hexose-6-phosphate dehydrogenase